MKLCIATIKPWNHSISRKFDLWFFSRKHSRIFRPNGVEIWIFSINSLLRRAKTNFWAKVDNEMWSSYGLKFQFATYYAKSKEKLRIWGIKTSMVIFFGGWGDIEEDFVRSIFHTWRLRNPTRFYSPAIASPLNEPSRPVTIRIEKERAGCMENLDFLYICILS